MHVQAAENVFWQQSPVTLQDRERLNGHAAFMIWLTGLSGSGKTTLAHALESALHRQGVGSFVLDGDNLRHGLCADLGFSDDARRENLRRAREVAHLMTQAGLVVIAAFISPFEAERQAARCLMPPGRFIEVYCDATLAVCEARDPKGLYRKARAGALSNFTGISAPYEAPVTPEFRFDMGVRSTDDCVKELLAGLRQRDLLQRPTV